MKIGIIYRAVSPSGNCYVGQTIRELKRRKVDHFNSAFNKNSKSYNTKFSRAIKKYGKDGFVWEILHDNVPEGSLNKFECDAILLFNSFNRGYNSTSGGDGIGRIISIETRKRMSKAHSTRSRKPLSEETKKKISVANIGKKHKKHTNEAKRKMSVARKGKKLSEEHKNKMSLARRGETRQNSNLTMSLAREIRKKYEEEKLTYAVLGEKYGVNKNTIGKIIRNERWTEL